LRLAFSSEGMGMRRVVKEKIVRIVKKKNGIVHDAE